MTSGLFLVLLAGPSAFSMTEAIDQTSTMVERTLVTPVDLAVVVEGAAELGNLESLVLGLLSHRLERTAGLGERVQFLGLAGRKAEERARTAGAEWLLRIVIAKEGARYLALRAELSEVDRGFWWPDPSPTLAAMESFRVRIDERVLAWMAVSESPAVRIGLSTPRPWLELDEAVLDLTGCELDRSSLGEELVVLTRTQLRIYRLGERAPTLWMRYGLRGSAPAAPLRAARGRVICEPVAGRSARVWVGSSDFAEGAILSLNPAGTALLEEERQPGIPLVLRPDRKAELGLPDPNSGGYRLKESGRVVLDLIAVGDRSLALLPPGDFVPLDAAGKKVQTIARGGLGSPSRAETTDAWVTTSSTSWRGVDHLTLRDGQGQPVAPTVTVPGPVRAAGFLTGAEGDLHLIVAVAPFLATRSTLLKLAVGGEAGTRP